MQAEEAYRVEGSRAAAREQELRERLSRAEAKALLLEKSLEAPREQLCEANAAEVRRFFSVFQWDERRFGSKSAHLYGIGGGSDMRALLALLLQILEGKPLCRDIATSVWRDCRCLPQN